MKLPRYQPMLPIEGEAGNDVAFSHEIKWDGFRVLAYHTQGLVELESRGGFALNDRFPSVVETVSHLDNSVVLDGEVVAFDEGGRPNFTALQRGGGWEGARIRYVVFDLLHLGENSLCSKPWIERRALLEEHCAGAAGIIISPLLAGDAAANLKFAREHRLEGIVSKKRLSPYEPGRRSAHWCKQKIRHTLDCIVVGVRSRTRRISSFSAALRGRNGHLVYVGNVGSGLGGGDIEFLQRAVDLLAVEYCPVINPPAADDSQTWFRPHLVAEIEYLELTEDMKLRHPVFIRFRFDKKAQECIVGVEQI